jgi:hypothetical protein
MRGTWSRYINKWRLAIATGFLLREIFEDLEELDFVFIQWIGRDVLEGNRNTNDINANDLFT